MPGKPLTGRHARAPRQASAVFAASRSGLGSDAAGCGAGSGFRDDRGGASDTTSKSNAAALTRVVAWVDREIDIKAS
jgi:hypothetical protein